MIKTTKDQVRPFIFLLAFLWLLTACQNENENNSDIIDALAKRPTSWLITNVTVIDGSGSPGFVASVRVKAGMITEVGLLSALPGEAEVNGNGHILAPGFIDTHSHADSDIFEVPGALPAVSQGITTVVVGQDGSSPFPLMDFIAHLVSQPTAVNIATYAGHNTIRRQVMGQQYRREANADEIQKMMALMQQEMEAGALGMSSGLEYDPGIYSSTSEVLEIAQVAADMGGRYISHMRSEDRYFEKALDEIIEIGRVTGMPVQISHIKLAMKRLWGQAPEFLAQLDAAREDGINISADIYPYEYWQSNLMVLLPGRDTKDRKEVELALSELAPPDGIWLTQFDPQPEYVGKTLTEIAALRKTDAATAFVQLIEESQAMEAATGVPADAMIGTSMIEDDILTLLKWPNTNVCTDGGLIDLHPRARGSFPRVLGRYVGELKALTLEQAIHKMTGLSAEHMGLTQRGLVRAGMAADLVLFDPKTIIDHATPQDSQALSTGIYRVWVNGISVYENGAAGKHLPGRFLKREKQ